jgi:hypothetical protein
MQRGQDGEGQHLLRCRKLAHSSGGGASQHQPTPGPCLAGPGLEGLALPAHSPHAVLCAGSSDACLPVLRLQAVALGIWMPCARAVAKQSSSPHCCRGHGPVVLQGPVEPPLLSEPIADGQQKASPAGFLKRACQNKCPITSPSTRACTMLRGMVTSASTPPAPAGCLATSASAAGGLRRALGSCGACPKHQAVHWRQLPSWYAVCSCTRVFHQAWVQVSSWP